MRKIHALAVAAILAVSAVFGLAAATRTAGLHSSRPANASSAAISARAKKLDRVQASLRRALRDKPPALPAAPASVNGVAAGAPQVVYHRPAPIIVVKHRSSVDGEHEAGHERETDD